MLLLDSTMTSDVTVALVTSISLAAMIVAARVLRSLMVSANGLTSNIVHICS